MPSRRTHGREDERAFRLAITCLFPAAGVIAGRSRRHADAVGGTVSRAEEPAAMRAALGLTGALMWGSAVLFVVSPGRLAWARMPVPRPARFGAVAVAASCLPLMWWVFRSLGTNVTRTVATRSDSTLVTHGPYRWVRHPLYSVGAIFGLALGVIARSALTTVSCVVVVGLLARRTRREEEQLVRRFGDDYRDYAARTGAFVPRLRARQRRSGSPRRQSE